MAKRLGRSINNICSNLKDSVKSYNCVSSKSGIDARIVNFREACDIDSTIYDALNCSSQVGHLALKVNQPRLYSLFNKADQKT